MPNKAERKRHKNAKAVQQCLLSSANPKAFGKKAANVLVKRPIAAYVEKVYELGDFGGLGL